LAKNKSEQDLANHLNKKKFSDLDEVLKPFVTMLNDNIEPDAGCMIYAENPKKNPPSSEQLRKDFPGEKTWQPKRDIIVTINGASKKVSCKSGKNNSFHQEKWKYFSKLLSRLGACQEEIDAFYDFVHSKDKQYFKGKKKPDKKCLKNGYEQEFAPDEHAKVKRLMQDFLKRKKKKLLTHFVKTGHCSEEGHAKYVYHCAPEGWNKFGDVLKDPKFERVDLFIEKMMKAKDDDTNQPTTLPLGGMSFQRWNTCPKSKYKLDTIQWGKGLEPREHLR
jgi:hypothetical protein